MTYEQALTEYVAARDHLDKVERPTPASAGEVERADTWLVNAALTLAAAAARREGR